jgi:hypothetical protein
LFVLIVIVIILIIKVGVPDCSLNWKHILIFFTNKIEGFALWMYIKAILGPLGGLFAVLVVPMNFLIKSM